MIKTIRTAHTNFQLKMPNARTKITFYLYFPNCVVEKISLVAALCRYAAVPSFLSFPSCCRRVIVCVLVYSVCMSLGAYVCFGAFVFLLLLILLWLCSISTCVTAAVANRSRLKAINYNQKQLKRDVDIVVALSLCRRLSRGTQTHHQKFSS